MDTTKAKKSHVNLSKAEWADIRTVWENDPREGHVWLVTQLDLTVTRNAIIARAKREGWTKRVSAKSIIEQSHRNADSIYKVDSVTHSVTVVTPESQNSVTVVTTKEANEIAIDLRTAIIQSHRDDTKTFREKDLPTMIDIDSCRVGKMRIDAIKVMHDIERKAWNLDANVEDTSAGMATDAELEAIYSKAMAESRRMQKEVEKRNRENAW